MASFLLSLTAQHYRQRRSVQKVYQNEIRHVCKDNPYTRLIKFNDDLPKIIYSQRTGTSVGVSNCETILFRDVANDYIARIDALRKRKEDERSRINRWIAELGDLNIDKIGQRHIEKVLAALAEEGYQPGTVLRFFGVVKTALNDARRLGLLKENPATKVQPPKVNNVLVRYLTADQETNLLDHLPEKYRSIVIVVLNSRCRQGELLRLTWADVGCNTGILTVRETKAGDPRRVPMNSMDQRLLTHMQKSSSVAPQDRIFPLDARYLRKTFDKAVIASGLAPFRFQDLAGYLCQPVGYARR